MTSTPATEDAEGLDEARRHLYMTLPLTRRPYLAGTVVNALAHHYGLGTDPASIIELVADVIEGRSAPALEWAWGLAAAITADPRAGLLDEPRRVLYMAIAASRTKHYEITATLVNALAHHQGSGDPKAIMDTVVSAFEAGDPVARAWARGEIIRITAELGSQDPTREPADGGITED